MRVYLNEVSTNSLTRYIYQYKDYFRNLYSDTGIFSESEILHYYETEAEKRKIEILEIIQTRLSPELVL